MNKEYVTLFPCKIRKLCRPLYLKNCNFFYIIFVRTKYHMWPPNRCNFQNRILNDFFLSLKDKKLKRCPSCNVLPFSLDRLGQEILVADFVHTAVVFVRPGCLLFSFFFLPHIAKLSRNISLSTTDKRTDVWSQPSCIYTQIFSPKKPVFSPIKNTLQICFDFCLPLFYATFQCGPSNIFKTILN